MSQTALKSPEPVEKRYSAKSEINTFMRRFLAHVKQDNARARDLQSVPSPSKTLDCNGLAEALERFDCFLLHFDLARIKVVELELFNDSSRRNHEEELRNYSSAIDEWKAVYKELRKEAMYLEQKVALLRLVPSRKALSVQKEKRILRKVASRRRLGAGAVVP